MTWQPISTAPRDGTWILAWLTDGEIPCFIVWQYRVGWRHYAQCLPHCGCMEFEPIEPTHWMPLPDPPTQEGE